MLKITKSLIVILGISVLAVGATTALFTDQKTIANNSFSTGTLKIELGGSGRFAFSNWQPGSSSDWRRIEITNTGTLPGDRLFIAALRTGDQKLFDVLQTDIRLDSETGTSIYYGALSGLNASAPFYQTINPGDTLVLYQRIWLWHYITPGGIDDNSYQNLGTSFDEQFTFMQYS